MRIAKIDERIRVKNNDQIGDRVCAVTSIGFSTVVVRPLRSKDAYIIDEDDIIFLTDETFMGKEKREIIARMANIKIVDHMSMIQQLAMFNRLFDWFPNCSFWRSAKFDFKPDSLAYYMAQGKHGALGQEFVKFTLDFKPKVNSIGGKKLGEDVVINEFKLE